MDRIQAINSFWNSYGVDAYDESTVPDNAVYPRITYEVGVDGFNSSILLSASVWYLSTSWAEITAKAEEIYRDIGLGGKMLIYDTGALWIKRGSPFYQRMKDPDSNIRRILMNIEVEFLAE